MPAGKKHRKSRIEALVGKHENWRARCLNLMASENMTSPTVRAMLSSDLGHRYTLPVNGIFDGSYIDNAYRGVKYTEEIQAETEALARKVFGCKYASVNPLSGHLSGMMMLLACTQRGDRIMSPKIDDGGYHGYCKGYLPDMLGLRTSPLPFRRRDWDLDYEKTIRKIEKTVPKLVVLGISYFPFPYSMEPLRKACSNAGCIIGYDASHVLGLVAGKQFQDPLGEGAGIMIGSTHKTFPGPQGGIALTNDKDIDDRIRKNLTWRTLDNAHWNRIAALGQALAEMKTHGRSYAKQVIRNSRELAESLSSEGVPVRFKHRDFTKSHQVLLDAKQISRRVKTSFNDIAIRLEREGIIIDAVGRMGTAEVTRMGLEERDMAVIARMVSDVILRRRKVGKRVASLARKQKIQYCF
jgi:glycine hydroxymethyltransferase